MRVPSGLAGDLLELELAERVQGGGHQPGLFALAPEGDDQLLRAGPGLAERLVERLGLADQGDQAGRGRVVDDFGAGGRRVADDGPVGSSG